MAKFKVGSKVILGDHYINGAHVDWNPDMQRYVGKAATITKVQGVSSYYVDIDNGRYYWFEHNMKPAVEKPDQKCHDCGTSAPHGEADKNGIYTCDFCKALSQMAEPTPQQKYESNWLAIFGKK